MVNKKRLIWVLIVFLLVLSILKEINKVFYLLFALYGVSNNLNSVRLVRHNTFSVIAEDNSDCTWLCQLENLFTPNENLAGEVYG